MVHVRRVLRCPYSSRSLFTSCQDLGNWLGEAGVPLPGTCRQQTGMSSSAVRHAGPQTRYVPSRGAQHSSQIPLQVWATGVSIELRAQLYIGRSAA